MRRKSIFNATLLKKVSTIYSNIGCMCWGHHRGFKSSSPTVEQCQRLLWLSYSVFGHFHPAPCARAFPSVTQLAEEFLLTESLTVGFLISAALCSTLCSQQQSLILVIYFSISFLFVAGSLDSWSSQQLNLWLNQFCLLCILLPFQKCIPLSGLLS